MSTKKLVITKSKPQKYAALRSIVTIYQLLSALILVFGVLAAGVSILGRGGNIFTGLLLLAGVLLTVLTMQALAQLIELFLDMAQDMHTTAAYFERRQKP